MIVDLVSSYPLNFCQCVILVLHITIAQDLTIYKEPELSSAVNNISGYDFQEDPLARMRVQSFTFVTSFLNLPRERSLVA